MRTAVALTVFGPVTYAAVGIVQVTGYSPEVAAVGGWLGAPRAFATRFACARDWVVGCGIARHGGRLVAMLATVVMEVSDGVCE